MPSAGDPQWVFLKVPAGRTLAGSGKVYSTDLRVALALRTKSYPWPWVPPGPGILSATSLISPALR